jgi:hypothetical protein
MSQPLRIENMSQLIITRDSTALPMASIRSINKMKSMGYYGRTQSAVNFESDPFRGTNFGAAGSRI